jgi:hypothetical protein
MREHDIQFWDNQDGTWIVHLYTDYAKSKLRDGQNIAGFYNDAQMFRILLWAMVYEMKIDGPLDLTIDYLKPKP